jgi:hypothetical protein
MNNSYSPAHSESCSTATSMVKYMVVTSYNNIPTDFIESHLWVDVNDRHEATY